MSETKSSIRIGNSILEENKAEGSYRLVKVDVQGALRASINNVDNDGLYEIIIYQDDAESEKIASFKVKKIEAEMLPYTPES